MNVGELSDAVYERLGGQVPIRVYRGKPQILLATIVHAVLEELEAQGFLMLETPEDTHPEAELN